jgi:hypothetical protein
MEPTVFSNEWTCGKTLKPTTSSGRVVEDVIACKVENEKHSNVGRSIPGRGYDWHFFEKRSENDDCETLVAEKLKKRDGPDGGQPTHHEDGSLIQKRHGPDEEEMAPKAPAPKAADPPKAASGPGT